MTGNNSELPKRRSQRNVRNTKKGGVNEENADEHGSKPSDNEHTIPKLSDDQAGSTTIESKKRNFSEIEQDVDAEKETQIVVSQKRTIVNTEAVKMSPEEFKKSERNRWQKRFDNMSLAEKAKRNEQQKLRRRRDRAAINYANEMRLKKEEVIEAYKIERNLM